MAVGVRGEDRSIIQLSPVRVGQWRTSWLRLWLFVKLPVGRYDRGCRMAEGRRFVVGPSTGSGRRAVASFPPYLRCGEGFDIAEDATV